MAVLSKKEIHEHTVFCAFVDAAQLLVPAQSISNRPDPEPDILCSLAGEDHYFELSEIFWELPRARGETLAKGFDESDKAARLKSRLLSQGRTEEASRVATAGQFGYPPLLSLKQSLERKRSKTYTLHNRPCSLLLHYERQNPAEPYDLLFECQDVLLKLLTGSVFDVVWLYNHAPHNSISIPFGTPQFAEFAAQRPVPLSHFATAEQVRAVVGRMAIQEGSLSMAFDARYAFTFHSALRALEQTVHLGSPRLDSR